MKNLAKSIWTKASLTDRMIMFPTLSPSSLGADWDELDEIERDVVRDYALKTIPDSFLCSCCSRVLAMIHMGRIEGTCDACEAMVDESAYAEKEAKEDYT